MPAPSRSPPTSRWASTGQPMAARKNISGFFISNGNLYWNIRKANP